MRKSVLWGTFLLFGLTLVAGFYLRSESWIETTVQRPIQSDASDYYFYAYNLQRHQTYSRTITLPATAEPVVRPDAVRAPGYPLFLALLIDGPPTGKLIKKIQLYQMLVSTLTLIMAYLLFRCYLAPLPGCLAALLVAVSPHLIVFNSYILSETLFCFILVLMALLACKYWKNPTPRFSVILGLAIGAGSLIRPSLQYFPLVVAILLVIQFGPQRGLRLAAMVMLGFILMLSPWMIRNAVKLGKLSDQSLMINFLHHGMYPNFKFKEIPASYRRPYKHDPRSREISASVGSVLNEIKHRFNSEPMRHLNWFVLKKPAVYWSWNTIQGHGDAYVYYVSQTPYSNSRFFQWTHSIMKLLHGPLVVLGLFGCLLAWLIPRPGSIDQPAFDFARFIAALLFYFTFLHMIGAPFPRYSVPLRPFLYGMAMFGLQYVYTAVKSRKAVKS